MDNDAENQMIEIQLLLDAVYLKYGYDFRGYAEASLKRRILRNLDFSGYRNISELLHHVLNDKSCFEKLLLDLSINVTDMFRDPLFYKAIRDHVLPDLKKLPFIKVWHAGCASGEEVYSMAILFFEEGLDQKTRVYATDFNEKILIAAREGIYSLEKMKAYTANYHQSGGKASFGDYYAARHDHAAIHESFKKNIVFAHHNLVSDGPFGEMDLIFCRNVLIYFNRNLQNRVFHLFNDSLGEGGYLCLGSKESPRYSTCSDDFEDVVPKEKIYRKKMGLPV
ncbi:MAG: protein-glutamate O-methyltransferase CheR [Deltaproteobacteria bacterium]|nr:protein-glutamate O-methyltransferase CheR [Deltaproteobacteria bacterium]